MTAALQQQAEVDSVLYSIADATERASAAREELIRAGGDEQLLEALGTAEEGLDAERRRLMALANVSVPDQQQAQLAL
jgi:hypothetical protein